MCRPRSIGTGGTRSTPHAPRCTALQSTLLPTSASLHAVPISSSRSRLPTGGPRRDASPPRTRSCRRSRPSSFCRPRLPRRTHLLRARLRPRRRMKPRNSVHASRRWYRTTTRAALNPRRRRSRPFRDLASVSAVDSAVASLRTATSRLLPVPSPSSASVRGSLERSSDGTSSAARARRSSTSSRWRRSSSESPSRAASASASGASMWGSRRGWQSRPRPSRQERTASSLSPRRTYGSARSLGSPSEHRRFAPCSRWTEISRLRDCVASRSSTRGCQRFHRGARA